MISDLLVMKRSNEQISDEKTKALKFSHIKESAQDSDDLREKALKRKVLKLTSFITEHSDYIEYLREDLKFYQAKERQVLKNVERGGAAVKEVLSASSENKFDREQNVFVPFGDNHLLPTEKYLPENIDIQDIYKLYVLLSENELFEQDAVELKQTIERRDKRIAKLKTKIAEHEHDFEMVTDKNDSIMVDRVLDKYHINHSTL